MKARRFFAFVAGAAMLFGVGCTPEGEEADGNKAEITVSPATISATLEGTTETLQVTSNADWVVTCDQSDVVVSTLVGRGNTVVTVEIPTVTAARNFVIKFTASKMMSVAGVTVPSTKSFDVQVSQNSTGTNLNEYAYYEDCGDGSVSVSDKPYIDKYTGWNKQGDAAADVTYGGSSASVRHSGQNYQPTVDAIGVTGAPYVFLNKVPASANFVIKNIAVKGGAQYIFTFNVSCQNAYVDGKPGFAEVTNELVHLELGYDGTNWAKVNFSVVANGGNGWYATTTEFKTKADATKLYARFTYEAPAQNGGGRFDDFKLVEGGNGAELEVTTSTPTPDPTPSDAYFYESFTTGQGEFTINDVTLAEGLTYVWNHSVYNNDGYMKASAYANNACHAAESWLISPEFSLAGATTPALTFTHAANKFNSGTPAEFFTVHIKEVGGEWAQLTIPTHGTGNSWTFVESGNIDLTAYVGKTVQIAFKYTSTDASAGTWEVKNVKVAEGNGSTTEPEQPGQGGGETPETPATGYNFNSDTALVCNTNNSTNCVYTCTVKANGSSAVNGNGFKLGKSSAAGVFTSGALGVTGEATLEFYACAWTGKTAKLYIRLEGSEENLAVIDLASNSGATGTADPYTITYSENEYHTVQLTGLTADSKLQFSTSSSFTAAADSKTSRALVVGVHVK